MADTSILRSTARALAVVTLLWLVGCAGEGSRPSARPSRPAARGVLTVEQLADMALQGTPPTVMYAEVQRTGTIYRLTTQQRAAMRDAGVPASLLGDLQIDYERALRLNPSLERSDEQWHEIDGYWYGGSPFGWPREWVTGVPPGGGPLH